MLGAMGSHERKSGRKRLFWSGVTLMVCVVIFGSVAAYVVTQRNTAAAEASGKRVEDVDVEARNQKRADSIEAWLDNFRWNATISPDILVGAYYYPWHSDDFHRGQGYLREQLDPLQAPTLGEYDDSKPETVTQHLVWSRQANIGLWVTSWWGEGEREDTTIRNTILAHEDLQDHKIALFYETTNRVKKSEDYSTQRIRPDLKFMCAEYFDHPNYLTIDGRPVLFVYLSRVLWRVDKLSTVVDEMRAGVTEACGKKIYIVGDHTFRAPPSEDGEYGPFNILDAVTTYDVYGGMTYQESYAGLEALDKYYDRQLQWKAQALAHNCSYIPAASPGFNDLGVRPDADHHPLSRRLTAQMEEGSLFRATLSRATKLADSTANNILMINSFNEWHEDTQIEPTSGEVTTSPGSVTRGISYDGYGELYLDILRSCTVPDGACFDM